MHQLLEEILLWGGANDYLPSSTEFVTWNDIFTINITINKDLLSTCYMPNTRNSKLRIYNLFDIIYLLGILDTRVKLDF